LTVENTKKTAGRYWDRIHLVTDSKIQEKITIPIYGSIIDDSAIDDSANKKKLP